jgi:hypothetical protein
MNLVDLSPAQQLIIGNAADTLRAKDRLDFHLQVAGLLTTWPSITDSLLWGLVEEARRRGRQARPAAAGAIPRKGRGRCLEARRRHEAR